MLNEVLKEGKYWLHKKDREWLRKNHPLGTLFWECTLNCNFYCEHCGSCAGRNVFKDELTEKEILKAFNDIAQRYNPKNIIIAVTGGEPLLRKDLFRIMKKAKEMGFHWGMVTNGYLLNKETVKKLKDSGMSTITVSIDGIGKTHDNLRKMPGSYDRAIEGIKILAEEDFLQHLQITTSISKKNIGELEKMYKEFSKLPLDSWRVMNVDPIGRAEDNKDLLIDDEQLKELITFIQAKRKLKGLKVTYGCSGYLGEYEGEVRDYFFNCRTGITVGSILNNGDIFVCPNVPRHKDWIQGNVRKDNFVDVWEKKYKMFREKDRTKSEHCSGCEHWEDCLGNGFHLWDRGSGEPKFCHLERLGLE